MKKFDLAVKTGTYADKQTGEEKGRYENIGEVHDGKDGGFYARLNVIRLLGVCQLALAKGEDSIIASMFAPRSDPPAQQRVTHETPRRTHGTPPGFDDDVNF